VGAREVLDEGTLDPREGLVGDTWGARASARTAGGTPQPDTQLTLMNARTIALLCPERERWPLAGDQLYVDLDLSPANLPPGTRLALGGAVIEVTSQPHTGCRQFVDRFGLDAMKLVNSPAGRALNLRGIYAKVVTGGKVRVGDLARKVALGVAALVLALWGAAPAALAQVAPTEHEAHRLHRDPTSYIASLEDPARDAWQKPREVVAALGLREGERVADIGAGSGYFALRFAHHLGQAGHVFAVDVSRPMIDHLTARVADAGLTNVTTVLAAPDDPKLPEGGIDTIFVCNTWHHIDERPAYLRTLQRALRPGGRVVIVDFHKEGVPVGPPPSMKLTREEVVAEAAEAGFALVEEHELLPYQYFLEFRPK
jgi:arsenite methyltransferase